jgi:hypothetical protein
MRVGGGLRADHATGAAAVVDHDLLAEALAELGRDHAADHIVAAARRERDDQPDRLGGIILRCRSGCRQCQQGASSAQHQRSSF